ncbi:MAG: parC [Chlamydiales bacterium]|jgi:topoisomerase-4 subunit A|nr:parC [Chlamydiales bacterium]
MNDLKYLFKKHYLEYASYVILERAIPDIVDGLKPVQRRILYTLQQMDDGKLHKVANVSGQTMAFHPHGDAPIYEALVNLANKGYLLDRQGNFGNIYTGDPAAAARYIETRLSALAKEAMFNPELTSYIPSYDGRNKEPVSLPAKIPLLLMQGAEGIAVGMSTYILPHNFVELLEAEIAIIENKPFSIVPDFPTGGIMDATNYDGGKGKVKLRANIAIRDDKTLVINQICYGTSTESLTKSIEEAAKKGKIKIDSIHDYTAENVEIEIKLPRGQHAQQLIDALYVFTDCEVTLNPQMIVIKDSLPWETTVDEMLRFHVELLQGYLRKELEIKRGQLLEKIFQKSLERIFIENRIYKAIEELTNYQDIHNAITNGLIPFYPQFSRIPNAEDRERLLNIPIRRISLFDMDKNLQEIQATNKELQHIEKELGNIPKFTIRYLKTLLAKYGDLYPRRTKLQSISEINVKAIDIRKLKVGIDLDKGFIGTKVDAKLTVECAPHDKLLVLFDEGSYMVINPPEKEFMHHDSRKITQVLVADKKTVLTTVYRDPKSKVAYAKRFIVSQFILEKMYRYAEEGTQIHLISTQPQVKVTLTYARNKKEQEVETETIDCNAAVPVKGVSTKGIRLSPKEVAKLTIHHE